MLLRIGRVLRGQRGASAVEFAIVMVPLVLLLVGITQFGISFWHWLEVVHAAREGARWASLENPDDATRQKVLDSAPVLKAAYTAGTYDAVTNIVINPSNPSVDEAGLPVTVTVSYDSPIFFPIMKDLFGTPGYTVRLTGSASQRIE